MKRILLILIAIISFMGENIMAQTKAGSNVLIAYYSRRGSNYRNGEIVNLKVGNTEVVAGKIQKQTGGDTFYIETVKPYPADYHETTQVAKRELNENARPVIRGKVADMQKYDVIYLGYPNWWGTVPMAVMTFLESYDFSGKTIIPFCTNEGSGLGSSVQDIKKACPKAVVKQGLAIRGGSVDNADKQIIEWLENTKTDKYFPNAVQLESYGISGERIRDEQSKENVRAWLQRIGILANE